NIVSPTEVIVVSSFHVELEGGGGDLHVTMPYSMLEPIRDLLDTGLQSDRSEVDERWTQSLHEEMKQAEVELSSTLVETRLSLRQVLDLEPGDIIPIDMPERVMVRVEDVPAFRAQVGARRGQTALKILGKISHNVPLPAPMAKRQA